MTINMLMKIMNAKMIVPSFVKFVRMDQLANNIFIVILYIFLLNYVTFLVQDAMD